MLSKIILIAALAFTSSALAEYRVFELEITDQKTGTSRKVIGTLDDIQYRGYHPVGEAEQVKINDTWMCYKNQTQNYRSYCPSPRAPASPVVK